MKTLVLYRTMFKQTIIGLRRYMFETLTATITLFLFFLTLFYGAKALGAGAPKFGNALEVECNGPARCWLSFSSRSA